MVADLQRLHSTSMLQVVRVMPLPEPKLLPAFSRDGPRKCHYCSQCQRSIALLEHVPAFTTLKGFVVSTKHAHLHKDRAQDPEFMEFSFFAPGNHIQHSTTQRDHLQRDEALAELLCCPKYLR